MPAIERITKAQLLEHLTLLDNEGRAWRFGYAASDSAIQMYVDGIADVDLILGIRADIYSEVFAATIHLSFDIEKHSAEMGLSTLIDHRRKGFAERLMHYAIDVLRNRNIRELYSVCLPDNQPLLKLLRKLNITSVVSNDGDKEARVNLPIAGLDSLVHEMQNRQLVVIDRTMKPWASIWKTMFLPKLPNN